MKLTQIRYELDSGVATITLHRPNKLNAVTERMRDELIKIFAEANRDDMVRVVVVTGAGEAFCAGADLSHGGSTFDEIKRMGGMLQSASIEMEVARFPLLSLIAANQ